jgi:hypothetical protein
VDRKQHQEELIFKLGLLLSPLYDIVNNPDGHNNSERVRARAKYHANSVKYANDFEKFTQGEPGHDYLVERNAVFSARVAFNRALDDHLHDIPKLSTALEQFANTARNALSSIPVPIDGEILSANNPFSCYCRLRDLCGTANKRLILVDRYMDDSLFHRYFRAVPRNTQLYLVTYTQHYKPKEWSDFLDVSRLFAAERTSTYRLITHPNFHDRWLFCDDQIYSLGGSLKDACKKSDFTITEIDPTLPNAQKIVDLVNTGTEVFGPTQTTHP